MGLVIDLFTDPSLVITLLIALFAKRISLFGEYLVRHVKFLPLKIKKSIRLAIWRHDKRIVQEASCNHKVTKAIIRCYFLCTCTFAFVSVYAFMALFGPLRGLGELPPSVQLLITAPIYIFEVLWLIQRERNKALLLVCEKRLKKGRKKFRPTVSKNLTCNCYKKA